MWPLHGPSLGTNDSWAQFLPVAGNLWEHSWDCCIIHSHPFCYKLSNLGNANRQHMGKDWASRCILFILYSILRIVRSHVKTQNLKEHIRTLAWKIRSGRIVTESRKTVVESSCLLHAGGLTPCWWAWNLLSSFIGYCFVTPFLIWSSHFTMTKPSLSGNSFGEREMEWDNWRQLTQCRFRAGVPAHFSFCHSTLWASLFRLCGVRG